MRACGRAAQLIAVALYQVLEDLRLPTISDKPGLDSAIRLGSGDATLGVELGLGWASLGRSRWLLAADRRLVATLPLVEGPPDSKARKVDGKERDSRDEPVSYSNLLFAPHYKAKGAK